MLVGPDVASLRMDGHTLYVAMTVGINFWQCTCLINKGIILWHATVIMQAYQEKKLPYSKVAAAIRVLRSFCAASEIKLQRAFNIIEETRGKVVVFCDSKMLIIFFYI